MEAVIHDSFRNEDKFSYAFVFIHKLSYKIRSKLNTCQILMNFYDPESFCDFLQLSFLVFSEIMFRYIFEITKHNQIPFFSIEKLISRRFI